MHCGLIRFCLVTDTRHKHYKIPIMQKKIVQPVLRMLGILLLLAASSTGYSQITITVLEDQPISCHGNNDASASAAADGGQTPYMYNVDGGDFNNSTGFFIQLSAGTHTICARDANGNTACGTIAFVDPDPIEMTFTADSVVSCIGNDGAITVNITGGTNILQGYLTWWTNSAGDTLNDVLNDNFALSLQNLPEGNYNVAVEDDNGCFYNQTYFLQGAMPISITGSFLPIPCQGGVTAIDLTSTGGVPYEPFLYLINGAPVEPAYPAGSYTITASDVKGCTGSTVLVVPEGSSSPTTLTVSACDAYTWAANNTTYTSSGLYTVTLSNFGGCNYVATLDLTLNQSSSNSTTVYATGPYTWQVNGITYSAGGTYTFTSLNTSGCVHTETLQLVINANNLSLEVVENQGISCYGNNDGSADAIVTGTGPFHFSVDGGPFNIINYTFSSLSTGNHTICVKDVFDNIACATISFTDPDPLAITFVVDSVVSCLGNDGSLSAILSGGTNILQGYLTLWTNSNGDTINDLLTNNFALTLENLPADTYNIAIEDDHGCFLNMDGLLPSSDPIIVSAAYSAVSCQGASISINATGGVPYQPLTYLVNGLPPVSNYPAGLYTITATDAKGCSGTTIVIIPSSTNASTTTTTVNACTEYTWSATNITYSNSGIYSVTNTSVSGCDSISILNLTINDHTSIGNETVASCGDYVWNGGIYTSSGLYTFTSLNATGCINTATLNLTIILNPQSAGSISGNENGCSPGYDPSEIVSDVLPSGGSGAIEYGWFFSTDAGATSSLVNGATNASYDPGFISETTWFRRGARTEGCTDFAAVSNWVIKDVTATPVVTITAGTGNTNICVGSSVTLTAMGASDFVWSNGLSTASINVTPSTTTTYTVVGTTNGCSSTASISITVGPCADSICWANSCNPEVKATTKWMISGSTVIIRTTLSKEFVDNTYGSGAIGWPSGHSFGNLSSSDRLQLALYDGSNVKKLEFRMDYISSSSSAPSGYKSLGVSGGDGNMVFGSSSNIVSVKTSLDANFNQYGYVLTTNSPITNSNYAPNSSYPNWIYEVWYEVTVNLSAFGASGFGHPGITSLYASPNKAGSSSQSVSQAACPCNNYVTNGGTIGNDETSCGASMDPANIMNVTLPSGGVGGFEYRWLSSVNNGATSSVISGATGSSYDPGSINQTTWYKRSVRHIGCDEFDSASNWVKKILTICPPTYSSPASFNSSNEFINRVIFNSINNLSGNNNGYGDFSAMSTNVFKGCTVPITLTPGFTGSSAKEYWKVWIDWNYDGDWSDSGEMVAKENWNGTSSRTIDIEVPNSALTGYPLRMRIIMRRNGYASSPVVAGSNDKGEVEDYTVTVLPGAPRIIGQNDLAESINISGLDPISMVSIYPNPISVGQREIKLQYTLVHRGEVAVSLYSMDGRILHEESVSGEEGVNDNTLQLPALPAGMYTISVSFEKVNQVQKLIIR